eukprot:TRINITY_DN18294_c0_g1_i1.p1 TRINITY_DN18294_c0_g1~~TRINITY_DN18294_c0_g1_i1.p1  ORF type:complete len:444 (-),score=114.02 TRINITY_DN18294_c0_g1_i1:363-1610(-)
MAQTAVLAPAQGLCSPSTIVRTDVRGKSAFLGSNAAFVARSAPKHARRGRFLTVAAAETTVAGGISAEDVQGAINTVAKVSEQVTSGAKVGYETVADAVDKLVKFAKPAVETAAPVVSEYTEKALNAATPLAMDAAKEAKKALESAGIDTSAAGQYVKTATNIAGTAADTVTSAAKSASPFALSALETTLAQQPTVLAAGAGGLVLLYLLAPSLVGGLGQAFRGYAGDVTAAQALDLLTSADYTLIDLRTEREKSKSGTPSLPRNAQSKLIPVPNEEFDDRKLRNQLRNAGRVEAEVAAIKISNLKRLGKGSKIILLDQSGNVSKTVARFLAKSGFSKVFVVSSGFDGSNGWAQSKLGIDEYNQSGFEILNPGRVISNTGLFGGGGTTTKGTKKGTRTIDAEILKPSRLLTGGRD